MLTHADVGVDPRQTSSGPAPAGTAVRQRGAYSRIRIVGNLCVAACALPGSEPAVRAKEIDDDPRQGPQAHHPYADEEDGRILHDGPRADYLQSEQERTRSTRCALR